jgi:hypothetical protein
MSTIVTRAGKGSPLTHAEVDSNFTNLNSDKVEASAGTLTNPTIAGAASFADGSASAPAITNTGDTNTGIFFPAADTIAFSEGGTESARFDSSGNLGIGTASPAAKLHISSSSSVGARVETTGAGAGFVEVKNNAGSSYLGQDGTGGYLLTAYSAPFLFYTNNTERMRLDASGNLGLGVTPSAWNSSWRALQISARGSLVSSSSFTVVGQNWFIDSGGADRYIATAPASLYRQSQNDHAWFSAPSGTAGNAITFTQAMTLDASGHLMVGATSNLNPISNYKTLQVSGTNGGIVDIGSTSTTYGRLSADSAGMNVEATVAGTPVFFRTGGSERARIDSSGNLLIGYTSNDLQSGTFGQTIRGAIPGITFAGTEASARIYILYENAGSFKLFDRGSETDRLTVDNNGKVIISRSGGTGLQAVGVYNTTVGDAANVNIQSDGAFYRSTSSLKYKKNINDATHGLVELLKLRSVTYEGKTEVDAGKTFGGLIAEEVHEAGLTEFVQYAEDGSPDAIAYGHMVSLCVKAIQELKAEIDSLKAQLENK